jgi:hypothetical protein
MTEDDWNELPEHLHLPAINALLGHFRRAVDTFHTEPMGELSRMDELIALLAFLDEFLTHEAASISYTPEEALKCRWQLLPVIRMMLRLPPDRRPPETWPLPGGAT